MKGKKLKVYCLEILSLKDLYIRGRINQLIAATIDMKSRFNDLTREDYSRLSKEYIQNSVAEFFKFRKKLLDFDPGAYEDTLDCIGLVNYFSNVCMNNISAFCCDLVVSVMSWGI